MKRLTFREQQLVSCLARASAELQSAHVLAGSGVDATSDNVRAKIRRAAENVADAIGLVSVSQPEKDWSVS